MDSYFPPDNDGIVTLDSLIYETGGCGMFQIILVLAVFSTCLPIAWSSMFMVYGIYDPGWICLDHILNVTHFDISGSWENESKAINASCDVFENCQQIRFNPDISTIVSEWKLICSRSRIPMMIMSLQMFGMLIGAYAGGYLSDKIGRRYAHYGIIFVHGWLTLIAGFSVNWQMLAAIELLLGSICGFTVSTIYLYQVEFVGIRWRGVISCIPVWNIGTLTFSISAMLIKDWKYLHFMMSFFSFLVFLGMFWTPESMRWLAARDRIEEARNVAYRIAKKNKTTIPDTSVLRLIAEKERQFRKGEGFRYTYLDVFRRGLWKRSIIIAFTWFCMVLTFYAIGFGVKALSGNFFLNLILFSFVNSAIYPIIPLVANKIGRKMGTLLFLSLACSFCFSVVLVFFLAPKDVEGLMTMIFALLTFTCIDAAWCIVIVYSLELYPTVIRGLGYGFSNGVSRLGGIVAPYLIPNDYDTLYISYIILGVIILTSGLLLLTLPETRQRPLEDNMQCDAPQSKEVTLQQEKPLKENIKNDPTFNCSMSKKNDDITI